MKVVVVICMLFSSVCGFAVELPPGVDLEKVRELRRARREKSSDEIKKEENLVWMTELYRETSRTPREITSLEASRIEAIYEEGSKEEKAYAFSMMPLFQDVSRWSRELEVLLQGEEPDLIAIAVRALEVRLEKGSEREKIVLANNERVFALLDPIAERFPQNERVQKGIVNARSLSEPYKGKALPKAEDRPLESKRQPVAEPQAEGMGVPMKIVLGLVLAAAIGVPLWNKFGRRKKSP